MSREASKHEFSYYEKCEREVEGLREFLVLKGFGVECATEGVANTAIGLLTALFEGTEPVAPVSANFNQKWGDLQEWESPDQVPGGLPRILDNDMVLSEYEE